MKKPYIRQQEPWYRCAGWIRKWSKEPYIRSKEPYIRSKEPYIRSKSPIFDSKSPLDSNVRSGHVNAFVVGTVPLDRIARLVWGGSNVLLQCVAVCCSVLQCVAVCCSVLQYVAVCCSVLQCVAVCCSVLQCVAVCCSVLQCVAVWFEVDLMYSPSFLINSDLCIHSDVQGWIRICIRIHIYVVRICMIVAIYM